MKINARHASIPKFTLSAKDVLSVRAIQVYHDALVELGCVDQASEVEAALDEFVSWRRSNQDQLKVPDHRHTPVEIIFDEPA